MIRVQYHPVHQVQVNLVNTKNPIVTWLNFNFSTRCLTYMTSTEKAKPEMANYQETAFIRSNTASDFDQFSMLASFFRPFNSNRLRAEVKVSNRNNSCVNFQNNKFISVACSSQHSRSLLLEKSFVLLMLYSGMSPNRIQYWYCRMSNCQGQWDCKIN